MSSCNLVGVFIDIYTHIHRYDVKWCQTCMPLNETQILQANSCVFQAKGQVGWNLSGRFKVSTRHLPKPWIIAPIYACFHHRNFLFSATLRFGQLDPFFYVFLKFHFRASRECKGWCFDSSSNFCLRRFLWLINRYHLALPSYDYPVMQVRRNFSAIISWP